MQLDQKLKPHANNPVDRIAILGIGNELNGDDSAGIWVARQLRRELNDQPNRLVMDCGSIPENATGPLRRFHPHYILLVDAADLDEVPGAIKLVDLEQVRGFSASSHTLPLSVLAGFLKEEFKCEVGLCCIQPQSLEFESGLSIPVKQAVKNLVKEITKIVQ